MNFKSLVILSFIMTMTMSAQSRIVVATFKNLENANNSVLKLNEKLKINVDNFTYEALIKQKGAYHILVVEPLENIDEINKVLSVVKKEFKDAYVREILQDISEKAETQKESQANKEDVKQEPLEEAEVNNFSEKVVVKEKQKESISKISLQESIKQMLKTNPALKEAIELYFATGKDLKIANNGYYPTLDFTANYGYERRRSPSTNGKFNSGMRKEGQLTLVQNIYNGGATEYAINQERSRLNAVAFTVAEKADRLSLQMSEAYLLVIKEKALLTLAQENVQKHEEIYSQIKDRTESGFGKVSEERQAGSRLTLAKSNLIAQENNFNDALNTFTKLSGLDIKPEQLILPTLNLTLPSSKAMVAEKAYVCNPSILVQQANISLAKYSKDLAKSAFRPTLDLEAYARIGSDLGGETGRDDTYSALLRFNYNLYNRGSDTLSEEKAKIIIQQENYLLDNVKRDLKESLNFSWQSYALNKKKLEYLNEHKSFSKETLDAYNEEFKIGRRDLINLLDAENEYYNARREIINTEHDYYYAKYRLLDNMGFLTDNFEPGFAKGYIMGACSIEENY